MTISSPPDTYIIQFDLFLSSLILQNSKSMWSPDPIEMSLNNRSDGNAVVVFFRYIYFRYVIVVEMTLEISWGILVELTTSFGGYIIFTTSF